MLKTPICLTVSTLLLTAALLPGRAQTPASDTKQQPINAPVTAAPQPSNSTKVVIPALTEVPIIFKGEIQAGENGADSELLFLVAKDVYGPGHSLLIARGTPAVGQIVETPASQNHKKAAKRVLQCDYVWAQDKTHIPLRGMPSENQDENRKNQVVLLEFPDSGAVVDRLAGGKDAKLPLGKTYRVYVNADTQTEAPMSVTAPMAQQQVYAMLKNGDWAIGTLRQVGNFYIITNFGGSQTMKISEIRTLEYLQDAGLSTPGK